MLCAMGAILRRPGVGYNPAAQDVAALAGTVTGHLPELRAGLLEELAWACGAFRWPAYVAQLGLLERIAEEAFRRCIGRPAAAGGGGRRRAHTCLASPGLCPTVHAHRKPQAACRWAAGAAEQAAAAALHVVKLHTWLAPAAGCPQPASRAGRWAPGWR